MLFWLLRRLERKLPTGIQLSNRAVVFFDESGPAIVAGEIPIPARDRYATYVVLVDATVESPLPATALLLSKNRIVQATSPNPDRWKRWLKEKGMGPVVVAELPTPLEIGAIL